jgi:hypothetical protein
MTKRLWIGLRTPDEFGIFFTRVVLRLHFSDLPQRLSFVRYWEKSGHPLSRPIPMSVDYCLGSIARILTLRSEQRPDESIRF